MASTPPLRYHQPVPPGLQPTSANGNKPHPATATESTPDTMSDNNHPQNHQPRAPNGHNPTNLPPPAHALPQRPSSLPWVEQDSNATDNRLTEADRHANAYRQGNAQRHQQRPATGQLPNLNQSGFFTGNLPLSNAPGGAPPLALAQPGPLDGRHSLSHWFTGQGPFNSSVPPPPPPPPPFFAGGFPPPPFFPGGFPPPPPPPFAGSATSATAQPFGQIPHPPLSLPRFAHPSANITQSPVAASETPSHDAGVPSGPKERKKDPKIYLPAPIPTHQYLKQASLKAEVTFPPSKKLVILDLNGTLIYRPNSRKQPRKMIARPFLPQFLAYLFDNFAVMVWSSAKPDNVNVLVEIGLGEYRHRLIACWARETLGLEPKHYNLNVQCYKDLHRIWASNDIQRHMPGYPSGARFDQRNTILIDDSSLKAAAQPHNLLEIPEFKGMDTNFQDVLSEVVGYLEVLKMQEDVSKFIHKDPFRANGDWRIDWNELALAALQNHFSSNLPAR